MYAFHLIFSSRYLLEHIEQFRCCGYPLLHRVFDFNRIIRYIEDDRHNPTLYYNKRNVVVIPEFYCDSFVPSVYYIVAMPNL